jgi:hypothetical protein
MSGDQIINNILREIVSPLYGLAVGCSIVYFLFGVVKFMWESRNPDNGNSQSINNGKQHMLWGLLGLFMILSVGGILGFFKDISGGFWR